jgi:hypothetical protein
MVANRVLLAAIYTAAVVGATTLAFAQESTLVTVDIKNVADAVARNTNLEASKIPLTVQTPTKVASDVCGVAEEVLMQAGGGAGVGCVAMTTSPTLEQIVQTQVKENKQ